MIGHGAVPALDRDLGHVAGDAPRPRAVAAVVGVDARLGRDARVARRAQAVVGRRLDEERAVPAPVRRVAREAGEPSGLRAARDEEREPLVDELERPPGGVDPLGVVEERGVEVLEHVVAGLHVAIDDVSLEVALEALRETGVAAERAEPDHRVDDGAARRITPARDVIGARPVTGLAVDAERPPPRPRPRAVGGRHDGLGPAHVAARATGVERAHAAGPERRLAGRDLRGLVGREAGRAEDQVRVVEPGARPLLAHRGQDLQRAVGQRRDEHPDAATSHDVGEGVPRRLPVGPRGLHVEAVAVRSKRRGAGRVRDDGPVLRLRREFAALRLDGREGVVPRGPGPVRGGVARGAGGSAGEAALRGRGRGRGFARPAGVGAPDRGSRGEHHGGDPHAERRPARHRRASRRPPEHRRSRPPARGRRECEHEHERSRSSPASRRRRDPIAATCRRRRARRALRAGSPGRPAQRGRRGRP